MGRKISELGKLGKMTPAEWRSVEGVVLVVVVARRLRGQLKGLLHGNVDDGEQAIDWERNATPQHGDGFCTEEREEWDVGMVTQRSIWKAVTLRTSCLSRLSSMRERAQDGERPETATSMFLVANPTWMGDWGGRLGCQ